MKKRLLCGVSALALRRWVWAAVVVLLCVPDAPPRAETGGVALAAAPAVMPGGAGLPEEGLPEEGPPEGGPPPEAEAGQPGLGAEAPPAWVLAHGPYTHWYPDRTQLVKNRNTPGDETVWKDVIGTREFDTKGIAARWEGGMLHLAVFTNFPDRNVMAAGRPVAPADLALDLDGNGTLETGVVLTSVRSTGDRGVERPQGIRRAAAYRVTKWLRPDDILQHTYGQGWRWTGITGQELAYAAVPVWVGAGTLRDDLAVTVDWRVNGRGSDHVVLVTLAMTGGEDSLANVPIIWGTGVCGNDVIFAPAAEEGDLFENLAAEREAAEREAAEKAGRAGEGEESADAMEAADAAGDAAFIEDAVFGTAATDETADDGAGSEIVTEGISEGSDEDAPTWNETYPVAFGGEEGTSGGTTSGGTSSGGTSSGGTVISGGGEESGGTSGSLSGSGGGTSGGTGGTSSSGEAEGGGIVSGGEEESAELAGATSGEEEGVETSGGVESGTESGTESGGVEGGTESGSVEGGTESGGGELGETELGGTELGETEIGGTAPSGGEPENPLAPEGPGGGGEETTSGGGEPGTAVEITEPPAPILLGSLLAGYLAFRARRRRAQPDRSRD